MKSGVEVRSDIKSDTDIPFLCFVRYKSEIKSDERRKTLMKRDYKTPVATKIDFDYSKQVVASGQGGCSMIPVYTEKAHEPWEAQCTSNWKFIK